MHNVNGPSQSDKGTKKKKIDPQKTASIVE